MHCFVNSLPWPEPDGRKRVESAIEAGVGEHAEKIDHYSIVSAPDVPTWRIRFKLKDSGESFAVDISPRYQVPHAIERIVRVTVRGILSVSPWNDAEPESA